MGSLSGQLLFIKSLANFLQRAAVALLTVFIVLLPLSSSGLPWSDKPIIGIAYGAFICWALGRLAAFRAAQKHELPVWCGVAVVLVFGWGVTLFPSAWVDRSSGVILELDKSPWLAFGTIDQPSSVAAMTYLTQALAVLLMVLDLASERRYRLALGVAVVLAGFATAAVGLCFQTAADLAKLWQVKHVPDSVFGLFWYHGNAASFLNLCWPVTLWLCMVLMRRDERRMSQQVALAFLVMGLAVQMVGVFANVSKMGHFLMLLQVLVLGGAGVYAWRRQDLHEQETVGKRFWLLLGITLAVFAAGAWMAGATTGWNRWGVFAGRGFDDPARRHAAEMALKMGWDHGWKGTGPGTFEWVSAHYSVLDPMLKDGRWRNAHNDYAQYYAEWGWLGSLLLGGLVLAIGLRLGRGFARALQHDGDNQMSFVRQAGLLCLGAAIFSVLAHAVVDFPLQIPAIRSLAAVLVGMMLAMCQVSKSSARPRSTSGRSRQRHKPDVMQHSVGATEGQPFFS